MLSFPHDASVTITVPECEQLWSKMQSIITYAVTAGLISNVVWAASQREATTFLDPAAYLTASSSFMMCV